MRRLLQTGSLKSLHNFNNFRAARTTIDLLIQTHLLGSPSRNARRLRLPRSAGERRGGGTLSSLYSGRRCDEDEDSWFRAMKCNFGGGRMSSTLFKNVLFSVSERLPKNLLIGSSYENDQIFSL